MERFERQLALPQIGENGQKKLKDARVAVVGAGGLGCPVLCYLACAGVGYIKVIDYDSVSETNLNRQMLYGQADIGKNKAELAAKKLMEQYGDIKIEPINFKLSKDNVDAIFSGIDVVVDCVDNVSTRIIVNDYVVNNSVPAVEAGISGFYGFVMSVYKSACLRCVGIENTKEQTNIPVIGATAGVIGSLQANECLKILLGCGLPLYNKMLQYDGLLCEHEIVELSQNSKCINHK